jgi:hypothetical protein
VRRTSAALASPGAQVLEGVILRYGRFYGAGTWYSSEGAMADLIRKRSYRVIGRGRMPRPWRHGFAEAFA